MALEDIDGPGRYIDALNSNWPTGEDDRQHGDDHIRGIKNTIKNTFPAIDGAVIVTQTELNQLGGVSGHVQTQVDGKANVDHTHTGYAAVNHSHSSQYALVNHGHTDLENRIAALEVALNAINQAAPGFFASDLNGNGYHAVSRTSAKPITVILLNQEPNAPVDFYDAIQGQWFYGITTTNTFGHATSGFLSTQWNIVPAGSILRYKLRCGENVYDWDVKVYA